jgi:hypothetical protein
MMKTLLLTLALFLSLAATPLLAQDASIADRETRLSLYPQPASTQLTISFGNDRLQSAVVRMYDLLGNLVSEVDADHFDNGIFSFYVGDKKPGYYFIKIFTEEGTFSRRITIKP